MKIKQKMKENVAATKFWIVMVLVGLQCLLLIGTLFARDRQIVPQSQLVTSQTFADGSGTIEITHQEYDSKNHVMKLDLQATTDLSMNQLSPNLFVKNGVGTMQYIPTIDNKAEIFIKNISPKFEAISLSFENNNRSNQDVDINIYDNSQDAKTLTSGQSSSPTPSNLVYFFISSNSKYLKESKKPIKIESQKVYAVEAIQSEIDFQNKQTEKMDQAISTLTKNQKDDSQQISELELKNDYLTGGNLSSNESHITSLQADIASKAQQIQQAKQNKQVISQAIDKMKQQISDIKSGKYKFPEDTQSRKLK